MGMNQAEIVEGLKALNPLPLMHYGSQVINAGLLNPDKADLLEQYVRTSKSMPISVEFPSYHDAQVQKGIELGRKYGTSIHLCTSPWQASSATPTFSTSRGVPYTTDVTNFTNNLSSLFLKINKANFKSVNTVRVKAVLIDSETWALANVNNTPESVTENHQTILQLVHAFFPGAKTIFYDRRATNPSNSDAGWDDPDLGYFVGDEYDGMGETGDYVAPYLYNLGDMHMMQESLRRNDALATSQGYTQVIPWVALGGSGYYDNISLIQWPVTTPTQRATTFPVQHSYIMGFMLNYPEWPSERPDRFAPTLKVSEVCWWPAPGATFVWNWWDHYLAYCQGIPNKPLTVPEPFPQVFFQAD